ncbi:MAG: porin [Hydrogenophaga sp.]|jgi:GBP family porin|uniref:porin n=1 Tax=unclassified Hydrogenophaga TaxID=2610897 RepID=UPI0036D25EEC
MKKKSVIGACLLVPPLAFAQAPGGTSSVQLYGRLDASVNAVRMFGTALTAARRHTLLSSDTSRWGVRGTEDLGGGHQAFFKLEQGFNADTGTLSSPTQAFNRETVVGLRHATLGSLALGSQFTPSIAMSLRIDPFQRSSMGAMQTLFQRGGAAGNLGYPVQYNNAIQYTSPTVGGFVGRVMVATNEGASPFGHPASYALEYAQGALYVGAVYDRLNTTGASAGQPGRASVSTDTVSLGASYDFRVAKLYGYLTKSDVDGSFGMRGGSVGVKVPVGPGEINATYQVRNVDDAAGSDARLWAVQYLQPLSRRTSVYVSVAHQRNDGAAAFGLWPSRADAGGSPAAGADVRGVQIGMRHVF